MAQEKKLLTLSQLSDWITAELQKNEDCKGATVSVQYELQKADEEGCNWSSNLMINPGTSTMQIIGPYLAPIMAKARNTFNVVS
jgi:hypothetical protein